MKSVWLGLDAPPLLAFGSNHWLHQDAAPDFLSMQREAQADGIDLQLVSSYRDFHRQLTIWNRKWLGNATLFSRSGDVLAFETLSETDKLHAILTWSALPGTSRHHWGTDIDVYDKQAVQSWSGSFELVDAEYCQGGPCYALADWLDRNAGRFGFHRPFLHDKGGVAVEKWHLSHTATAQSMECERDIHSLTQTLYEHDILGKAVILDNIEQIFDRYVMNKGER